MTVTNVDVSPDPRPDQDLPLETIFRDQDATHPLEVTNNEMAHVTMYNIFNPLTFWHRNYFFNFSTLCI